MPGLRDDFKAMLDQRKAVLNANTLQGEEMMRRTAEYIYLQGVFNQFEKANLWNNNVALRSKNLKNWSIGLFTDKQNERIGQIFAEIKRVIALSGITGIFPESLYFYVSNPAKRLSDLKLKNLKIVTAPGETYKVRTNADRQIRVNVGRYGNVNLDDGAFYEELKRSVLGTGQARKEMDRALGKTGLSNTRIPSMLNVFRLYLMSYRNLSLKEALLMGPGKKDFYRHAEAFRKFTIDHPITDQSLTEAKRKENLEAWVDVFKNCTDKFKEYRIPDIDYNNPDEVAGVAYELDTLRSLAGDYNQEIEKILKCENNLDAVKRFGGRDEMNRLSRVMFNMQQFVSTVTDAYIAKDSEIETVESTAVMTAYRRFAAKEMLAKYKGKTLGECFDKRTTEDMILDKQSFALNEKALTDSQENNAEEITNDCKSYLRGENPQFEERFRPAWNDLKEKMRLKTNEDITSSKLHHYLGIFILNAEINTAVDHCLENPDDANQIIQRVFHSPMGKSLCKDGLELLRNDFWGSETYDYYTANGRDFWDTIKIDGKSVWEKWGEKYAAVTNPDELDLLFLIELNREIRTGKSLITHERFFLNDKFKYESGEDYIISRDDHTLLRTKAFFDEVDSFHEGLNDDVQSVLRAQQGADEALKAGLKSNHLYNTFYDALNECYDRSDTTNPESSVKILLDSMDEVYTAAKAYHDSLSEEDKQQMRALEGKAGSIEKARLLLVEKILNDFPKKKEKLQNDARGLNLCQSPQEKVNPFMYSFTQRYKAIHEDIKRRGWDNPERFKPKSKQNKAALRPDPAIVEGYNPQNGLQIKYELIDEKGFFVSNPKEVPLHEASANQLRALDNKVNAQNERIGYMEKAHMFVARANTLNCIFLVWAMGEKGISLSEAYQLYHANDMRGDGQLLHPGLFRKLSSLQSDFVKYCENNGFQNADGSLKADNTIVENADKWLKVFEKATDKLKEYKFPDIDYGNKYQVQGKLSELSFIVAMTTNFGQEVPDFLSLPKSEGNTEKDLLRKANGKDRYNNMMHTWLAVQGAIYPLVGGYTTPMNNPGLMDEEMYKKTLHTVAVNRVCCRKMLNPIAGKTFGDIANLPPIDAEMRVLLLPEIEAKSDNKLTNTELFEYIMTGRSEKVEEKIKPIIENSTKNFASTVREKTFDQIHAVLHFPNNVVNFSQQDKQTILNTPDDARSMKQLLTSPSSKGTFEDTIYKMFGFTSQRDYAAASHYTKTPISSLIIFDNNQTAESLWGEKYADVANPWDKELLLCAEIIKKICKGDSRVYAKGFEMDETGNYHFVEPSLIYEPDAVMKGMAENYYKFSSTADDIREELLDVQAFLQGTQDKADSNKTSNNLREGTDLYQNMTLALDKCIESLKYGGSVKKEEIRQALVDLQRHSEIYYQERKGILFGPIRGYGKKRLAKADLLRYRVTDMISRMDALAAGMTSEITLSNGIAYKDATIMESVTQIKSIANKVGDGVSDADIERYQAEGRRQTIALAMEKIAQLPQVETPEEMTARNYLTYIGQRVASGNLFPLKAIYDGMIHYKERIRELAANRLFLDTVRENQDNAGFAHWEYVEKNKPLLADGMRQRIVVNKGMSGTLARNVASLGRPAVGVTKETAFTQAVNAVRQNMNPQNTGEYYKRLAENVVAQILMEESDYSKDILNRVYLNEYKEKNTRYLYSDLAKKEFEKRVAGYLKENHALEGNHLEDTLKKLENGKLKASVIKADKEREDGQKLFRPLEEINDEWIRTQLDHPENRPLSQREYYLLNERLLFNHPTRYMMKISEFAQRINARFPHVAENAGFSHDRLPTCFSMYSIWLMSEKGYTFSQVSDHLKSIVDETVDRTLVSDLQREFGEFCNNNAIHSISADKNDGLNQIENSKEKFKTAVNNWAECFRKAQEKIQGYRLPDIDYNNPEEIKNHFAEISLLCSMSIDFTQEMDKLMNYRYGDLKAGAVALEKMGFQKWNEIRDKARVTQTYLGLLKSSFQTVENANLDGRNVTGMKLSQLSVIQLYRMRTGEFFNSVRGQTLEEVGNDPLCFAKTNSIEQALFNVKTLAANDGSLSEDGNLPEISKREILDALYFGSDENLRNRVTQRISGYETSFRMFNLNNCYNSVLSAVGADMGQEDLIPVRRALTGINNIKDVLNETIPGGEITYREWFYNRMDAVFNSVYARAVRSMGTVGSDIFLINGQRPADRYAEKYADIQDPEEKEFLICAEVIKAMATGSDIVQIRGFEVAQDMHMNPLHIYYTIQVPELQPVVQAVLNPQENIIQPANPLQNPGPQVNPIQNPVPQVNPPQNIINEQVQIPAPPKMMPPFLAFLKDVEQEKPSKYPKGYALVKKFEKAYLEFLAKTNNAKDLSVLKKMITFEEELADNRIFQNMMKNFDSNKEDVIKDWIRLEKNEELIQKNSIDKLSKVRNTYGYVLGKAVGFGKLANKANPPKADEACMMLKAKINAVTDEDDLKDMNIRVSDAITEIAVAQNDINARRLRLAIADGERNKVSENSVNPELFRMRMHNNDFLQKNNFLNLFKNYPNDVNMPKVLEAFEKGDVSKKMARELFKEYAAEKKKDLKPEKSMLMNP